MVETAECRARRRQQGGGGQAGGGGRRTFAQVGLNGQDQSNVADNTGEEQQNSQDVGGQFGGSAGAGDAVQMMGTVAMGQSPDDAGGFGQSRRRLREGQADWAVSETEERFLDRQLKLCPAAPGGPGGGGPGGGGPGGGFPGRGGGRGPAQRGPRGAQGIDALMGAQRLLRQRINRVHYSFFDTFGDSALNARPYSLNAVNPPRISGWTESAGLNIGGPFRIPHVYDGTDKTFFFINFGGTWSRNPVDSFATVPTAGVGKEWATSARTMCSSTARLRI